MIAFPLPEDPFLKLFEGVIQLCKGKKEVNAENILKVAGKEVMLQYMTLVNEIDAEEINDRHQKPIQE